jgi:hypothetical protein
MSDKKRRCMNYRKGDDPIHGPMGPPGELLPGDRQMVQVHEKKPDRSKFLNTRRLEQRQDQVGFGSCNFHILTVAGLTLEQADKLLTFNVASIDYRAVRRLELVTFDISYPLKHSVEVRLLPPTCNRAPRMTIGYILWQAAQAYKQIYEEEAKDGRHDVWGHCLSDLYFEGVLPHASGYCELLIGS